MACMINVIMQNTTQYIMAKITPTPTNKSFLEIARSSCGSDSFWLKVAGYLCMPVCCIGCSCLFADKSMTEWKDKYDAIIALYGGKQKVKELSAKIANELRLFGTARTVANTKVSPHIIVRDVNMLDIIFCANPLVRQIMGAITLEALVIFDRKERNEYFTVVWNEYVNLGGNYHVIVYGIMEYLAMICDPTSRVMEYSVNEVLRDTAFRVECLSHRAAALA